MVNEAGNKTENSVDVRPLAAILIKPFAVMGIVNVTPDSFSDGGKYFSPEHAVGHACQLAAQGADILDIGGQSTRPGAQMLDWKEECERILPVIRELSGRVTALISVDTYHAETAKRALVGGAHMINDIGAGRLDPSMPAVIANLCCPVVLMHSRETPLTMQNNPFFKDAPAEVTDELMQSVNNFIRAGVKRENIIVDPGIGFAKRYEDNIKLLRSASSLVASGYPVCIGTSRKGFIGHATGNEVSHRLCGSLASIVPAFLAGVKIFRVHDVEETVQFLNMLHVLYE